MSPVAHMPAGTPEGGQFASAKGGGGGGQWSGSGGGPGGAVAGQSWDERQKGMFKITKKLDKISAGGGIQGNANADAHRMLQIHKDPDAVTIAKEGKHTKIQGNKGALAEPQLGTDGQCHWNTGKLMEQGKIDAVVIGFAKGSQGWHQHTWGTKGGKIVETTASNVGNNHYFGKTLSPAESTSFALWVKKNPPGSGVVRKVEWSED